MKAKILDWLKRSQKATAALAGAVGVLSAATWIPEPYGHYVAITGVFLTWLLTYMFPYVQKTVEDFPEDWSDWAVTRDLGPEYGAEPVGWINIPNNPVVEFAGDERIPYEDLAPWERELVDRWNSPDVLEGEVLDPYPDTVELAKVVADESTRGIPVINGESYYR